MGGGRRGECHTLASLGLPPPTGHTKDKVTQKVLNVLFTATQQCYYAATMLIWLCGSTIGFMSTMCYSAQGYVLLTLLEDYIVRDSWETMQHCQLT